MIAFLVALQFLTRIPVMKGVIWTNERFGRCLVFFPLVGMLLGLLLWGWYAVWIQWLDSFYVAIIVTGTWLFLTGGIHADGYMDTADGIFSGRDRQTMLAILKDSHVGANSVMAFVFLVLLKVCFLANVSPRLMGSVLVGVPAAARLATVTGVSCFPYARKTGLGQIFKTYAPAYTLGGAIVLALLPCVVGGMFYLVLLGFSICISLVVNRYITSLLGGLTGDTYGAVVELIEMLLLGLAVVLPQVGIG